IFGKADVPVLIDIFDEEVAILPADDLWGLDTYQIQKAAKEKVERKSVRVAGIGVAGENQINCACILSDHGRVAGRTGLGAVMGAKNLKAISLSGTKKIPVENPQEYNDLRSQSNRGLRESAVSQTMREMGTASVSDYMDYLGSMPKKGFTRGTMPGSENYSGALLAEKYLASVKACQGCVIACGREFKVSGKTQKGPEYETLVGFGPNLWVDEPEFTFKMNELCDLYGMDTISVSNTIGLAMRLFEEGLIGLEETGGLALEWGNQDAVEALVHLVGRKEGFGELVGRGSKALEETYGRPGMAIQVNGLEVAYHDPRALSGMALVYATSPRGACHNQSDYYLVEIGQAEEDLGMEFFERQAGAEKARNVVIQQNWRTFTNSVIICIFGIVSPQELVDLVNLATDREMTIEEYLTLGERGWNLKRVINNRLGLRREDDKLPKSLLEPLPDGGAADFEIDLESMLKAYYHERCWDWETGFPTKVLLTSLGLDFAIPELYPED
ncbi:MAG: aldehyde ferredoxin oxidoreductase family protein, partial [Anaerolineales bacterium]